MLTASVVLQATTLLLLLAAIVCLVQSRREARTHRRVITVAITASIEPILHHLNAVSVGLESIIEDQRLSTILRLEPASLKLDPAAFEARKPVIKAALLKELRKQWGKLDMGTRTFAVLTNSGWSAFVDNDTHNAARNALARLFANDDLASAETLCGELVDKL